MSFYRVPRPPVVVAATLIAAVEFGCLVVQAKGQTALWASQWIPGGLPDDLTCESPRLLLVLRANLAW